MVARLELAGRAATLAAAGTPFRVGDRRPGGTTDQRKARRFGARARRRPSRRVRRRRLRGVDSARPGAGGASDRGAAAVRITPSPDDRRAVDDDDGAVTVYNPCLSGGTLEIFLEPAVPLPVVAVFGHAPIATALLRAHRLFGQQVLRLEKPERSSAAGGSCGGGRLARQRRTAGPRGSTASGSAIYRIGGQPATGSGSPRFAGGRRADAIAGTHARRDRHRRANSPGSRLIDSRRDRRGAARTCAPIATTPPDPHPT